jgi:GNAT superfamily N-acetyltransferase
MSVLNGILVPSVAHEACLQLIRTGALGGAPDWPAILGDANVETYMVRREGANQGLLELDFRVAGEAELAFFGLDEAVLGQGAGRWLMNRALALAWGKPIARFWVHTCTLDHPSAPEFYQRSGFTVFKRGVEVDDDPRLKGQMPRGCAPYHPVIG